MFDGSLINRGVAGTQIERSCHFTLATMTFDRLLSRAVYFSKVGSRSVFTSSKPDTANPNWFRVGLAFGTSAFLWALLFKQHSTDVHEYKVRNDLE
ncbi:NADH dehydrogenase [ubiquinone] 1 subunit C1, mitochondrial isoform X2 [Micropterus dolomieu]|uniref:NADH dehydrogenase [ubiquinone] 1 subunit C1, mitochondrial isoform X2 n=1 Tax=Micropterus dolomieu TaxID=147949 RepID=UPI001E8E91F8|nr:NADH dehydrogenase [ubiquinone] 1 subunit C1, mitochondrial isoform X2 [Micropterus dolomieu]